ncbi:MAG TPA: class I SAM-dependent methyltransferase [Gammaproteobacteria bacterium]|nr:class I SAM-dependent methyltransferase [Gammaproteobacteria bacterium]
MASALGFSTARRAPEVTVLNAPLFRGLMEQMQDDARRVVLDLGPARPETVAILGRFRCRLEIVALAEGLDALNASPEPGEVREIVSELLPPRRAEAIDVVLCWDLLNYLERPTLAILMAEILERLRPGSLVHALIAYSTPRMSALPERIVPGDDYRLLHSAVTADERTAPRYSPDDLARSMPGYAVERAMLLRNGMQEFLFRH